MTLAFAPTGQSPRGITLDAAGNLYTANFTDNNVSKITPAGATAPFAATGAGPVAITTDPAGNLYTANETANSVTKITPAGAASTLGTTTGTPQAIVTDRVGNVYVATSTPNAVVRITPAGAVSTMASVGPDPKGIAIDPSGNVFTTNNSGSSVTKVTPAGVATTPFAATGLSPTGIVTDWAGNVYVTNANGSANSITKITPAGAATTPFASIGAATQPRPITIDSAGNVYTGNVSSGTVSKVTPAGVSSLLGNSGGSPVAIAVDSAGNIYAANQNTDLVTKISPGGGTPDIAPAPPATPAAPSASAGDGSATVTITANPADARHGAPTSYSVAASQDPSKACLIAAPATSCTVTGLTNGTAYTFTARANLNSWQTVSSSASAAVTPSVAPSPSTQACANTFYQQSARTGAWDARKRAYKLTSRIRIYEDPQAACRTQLSIIYRSAKTKTSLAQTPGSTLGFRRLTGQNFNAPVISWPTAKEMRFSGGDTTGQNRKNARLVLVSYLKKASSMPALNDIELVIVRRIPRSPAAAASASNPLFAQKNSFATGVAWATVS